MTPLLLPHSIETEMALLASVLIDPPAFAVVRSVQEADFYSPASAVLWGAFRAVHERREPIDHVTVRAALVSRGELAAVGGDEWLMSITDRMPDVVNVESYANSVRTMARHRALIRTCQALALEGYRASSFDDFRAEAERSIRALTTEEAKGDPIHVGEVLSEVIRETQRRNQRDGIIGFSTGLSKLDAMLGGWQAGKLYVVGGRPGMGKSALTTSTVMASTLGAPLLNFSIEMPNLENGTRLVSAESSVDLESISKGRLTKDEWDDLTRACARLHTLPIYVDDKTRTLEQIVSKSRKFKAKHGRIGPIVIDYLQLIRGNPKVPREQQISEVTRELKSLSKELDCPVVCLSQLNRQCEDRPDKRPQMSDLRESGAIEQDADVIVLIYRRGYYASQAQDPKRRGKWDAESEIKPGVDDGVTELNVAKHRGGRTGVVKCKFLHEQAQFVDLSEGWAGS